MKHTYFTIIVTLLSISSCLGQDQNGGLKLPNDTLSIAKLADESFNLWNTDPQKGIQLGERALKAAINLNHKKTELLAYRSLGVCYWAQANYSVALDVNFKGIKIAEQIKNNEILLALEHNLALIFGDLGDVDQSIYHLKRYILIKKELKKFEDLPGAYNNLGYYFSKKNLIDSSLYYYNIGLNLSKDKFKNKDTRYLYASLSEAYFAKKDLIKASDYNAKALDLYSTLNETIGIIESHTMVGRIAIANKNYPLAQQHIGFALKLVNQGHFFYHYIPIFQLLSEIDSAKGNYKQALIYYKKASILKDSINTIKQKQTFEHLLTQYRTDQQEKENLQLKKSNELIKEDAKVKRIELILTVTISLSIISMLLYYFISKTNYSRKIQQITIQQQVEKEKVRIAKELHDNIGSQLSVFSLDLNMLAKKNLIGASVFIQLSESIQATIDELRDTIWAMNKEEIDLEQLMEKINNLCWRFRKSTEQFQISFTENFITKKAVLKPNHGLNVFRIVQESVNNAIRHSNGNLININAEINSNKLIIEVHDNGNGFDKNVIIPGDHLGILNMKNRAEEMGAHLIIDPLPSGTFIILVVPIQV